MRTQVAIIGAGPAGLLLAQLLHQRGIECVILETRTREYLEQRVRAGVLEHQSVDILNAAGVGARMMRDGLPHHGIFLHFKGENHRIDFAALTGKAVMIYGQQEVVRDLIAARLDARQPLYFEVEDVSVSDFDTDRPRVRYRMAEEEHTLECDFIAGCDGFHGICRDSMPPGLVQVAERIYPYAWLGILASVPPSTDELIYARHEDGFALHTMRTLQVSRLYLQVSADEDIEQWSDDRIWAELKHRLEVPGWELKEGHISEKAISPMRSFVASPMRYRRLFLAGDAAHIVPPTGAKGLNLALADVTALAKALTSLLKDGQAGPADAYSDTSLSRVWRATHFSWWMTSMLHVDPQSDRFGAELQLSQLRYVISSRAAATTLAENYTGYFPLTREA